jgi:glycosyltransferase involved in cell wall biosynthesis
MFQKRLLVVSSHRAGTGIDTLDTAAFFAKYPYSLGAITYNLERLGWTTRRLGMVNSRNPWRLARIIDEFQPDIIYTYGSLTAMNPLWARRWLCRHRAFRVVHGWDDIYGDIWRDVYGWLPGKFMEGMERVIVTRSDAVVTLSRYHQQIGRRWGVESHYIPNGADIPQFDTAASTIRLEGRLKIVYTGDAARWKRTWEICAAMRHLPPEIKLYRTGGHYAELDQYNSENCIYLGYLSKNDQLSVMAQADVLVVTADQDCNAKIQEYLRFHKPILGYDGRANLFFANGRNALLTRDYPTAIRRLADDPALRQQLVEHADRELPVHTWAEIAAQFDACFRSVAGEGAGRS